jgi:hypothetical protein
MVEKKRRQGRGKTLKTICPTCQQEYLQACMGWQTEDGNRKLKRIGQYCPNPACDHIVKDFVELEDLEEGTEKGTDKGEKIKQLTAEFVKTHEQLNKLAEQINELEKE